MRSAKPGSIFVWPNGNLDYPRKLAKSLGRDDLRIVSPSHLRSDELYDRQRSIVIDHATVLTPDQVQVVEEWSAYRKAKRDNKR